MMIVLFELPGLPFRLLGKAYLVYNINKYIISFTHHTYYFINNQEGLVTLSLNLLSLFSFLIHIYS